MNLYGKIFLCFIFLAMLLPLVNAEINSSECAEECIGKVCVYYFYSDSCSACQSIKGFMKDFEVKYNDSVTLHRLNVNEPENFKI